MIRSSLRHCLLACVAVSLGCAVAENDEPNAARDEDTAGHGGSTGGKPTGSAGKGLAGSAKGGSASALAGSAGAPHAAGSGGASVGGAHGGSAGATGGHGGAAAGAAGSAGAGPEAGTTLFMDDFETGDAAGWMANTTGDWSVALDGANHLYRQATTSDALRISWVTGNWRNLSLEARVRISTFGGTNDQDIVCLYTRVTDDRNNYSAAVRPNGRLAIRRRVDGSNSTIGSSEDAGMVVGTWYTLRLEVSGTTLKAYVDGTLVNTQSDASLSVGGIGLGGDNSSAEFDDVVVKAL